MKSAGSARLSQTGPSGTTAVWFGSGPDLGTGPRLSVASGCRAGGISWLNFSVILVVAAGTEESRRKHGKFFDRAWIKAVGRHRRNHKCTRNYFHFYFSLWAAAKAEEEIKNSKASFPLTQRFCFIFCSRVSSVFFRSGRDFIWMH